MLDDLEYQNQGVGYGHNHQAHGSGHGYGMQMQQPYSGYQNTSPNRYPNGSNHQGSGYYSSQAMPQQGGGYGYSNPNPNSSAFGGGNIMSTVSNMMGGGSSSSSHGGGMKMMDMAKQGYEMYQKVQHPTSAIQQTKHHGQQGQQFSSCPSMNYHNGDAMGWVRNGRRSSEWN